MKFLFRLFVMNTLTVRCLYRKRNAASHSNVRSLSAMLSIFNIVSIFLLISYCLSMKIVPKGFELKGPMSFIGAGVISVLIGLFYALSVIVKRNVSYSDRLRTLRAMLPLQFPKWLTIIYLTFTIVFLFVTVYLSVYGYK